MPQDVGQVGSSTGSCALGQANGQHITVKEMLLVVVACAIWGPYWQHRQVLVLSDDNMAVVHVIHSQSSKERTILHLLRCSISFAWYVI